MSPLERLDVVSRDPPPSNVNGNAGATNWALQAAAAALAILMILAFVAAA